MWLTADAESLIHRIGSQTTATEPQGPAFRPYLEGSDGSWQPADFGVGANGESTPTDVVFVGHFDDRRAALCPETQRTACQDRFVVDSVARVHGVEPPISQLHLTQGAVSSDHEIAAIVGTEAPDSPVLSATIVDGPAGLAAIEPSLATGHRGLTERPVLWVVRVLESGRLSTYIVIDGSDAIYEMNPAGEAILVGGTPPTPGSSQSAGPWPPADALVLELAGGVGPGKPPVRVAIVDRSGRFASAMEQDPPTITSDRRFAASAEPGKPGRVNLTWIGGICDSQVTVTIGSDLRSITFDMGPQPDCNSMGVGHELVMYFTGTVDVPAIQVGEGTVAPAPAPAPAPSATGGPGYALDCGPVARDACEPRAAEIVATNPTKRVVSIPNLRRVRIV